MKTYVYVDGFNLYYGALKGTAFKWLDLLGFCRRMLPWNEIIKIKYFTAHIAFRADDPKRHLRQQTYLRALRTLPDCEIVFGHFLTHEVDMPLSVQPSSGSRLVRVIKTEEKGSDVNLAAHILMDGFKDNYEAAVVISNDSDLLTPIKMVKNELGKTVWVWTPHQRPSQVLKKAASFWRSIRTATLASCQFPNEIRDDHGMIRKPDSW